MTIDISLSRQRIEEILTKRGVAVLSTAAKTTNKPHAAAVYITYDKLLNLYFMTKRETQKYRNLTDNPFAAIAIYDPQAQTTVQAEGPAAEVTDPSQQEWIMRDIWSIANRTSSQAPPPTQLLAGGYAIFRLSAPSLRLATFTHPRDSQESDIFEVVHTQPA